MYRHPFAMTMDLSLKESLFIHTDGISDEDIAKINKYKEENKDTLSNFYITRVDPYSLFIDFEGRGTIENLALNLMPFLNFCAKMGIYINSSAPYYMSWGAWGDYESGAIYFETNENSDDNKAIITGVSCHGDIVVSTLPWKY